MGQRGAAGLPPNAYYAATPGAGAATIRCPEEDQVNEHRNLLLALLLSAIVLIGWSFLSSRFIQPANPPSTQVVKGKPVPLPQKSSPVAQTEGAIRDRALVLRETPRVAIETPSVCVEPCWKEFAPDELPPDSNTCTCWRGPESSREASNARCT